MELCPICNTEQAEIERGFVPASIKCLRSGNFRVTATAIDTRVKKLIPPQRVMLSGWVREQTDMGESPLIRDDNVERILQLQKPTMKERADRILLRFIRNAPRLNTEFGISDPALLAVAYVADQKELAIVLRYLVDMKVIEYPQGREHSVRVTPSGHAYADEVGNRNRESQQAFVAMWFDASMADAYQAGFEQGIGKAGYRAMRIDRHEHSNRIDDEIIAQIRRSRFLVADFTGQRNGVYFEAGFALGFNLPVIWTCRDAYFKEIHFDTRQFNCIQWTDAEGLARPLQMRIEAVVGRGSLIV